MSEPKGDAGDGTKRIAVDLGAEELAEILNGFDQDLWEHGPYFTRVWRTTQDCLVQIRRHFNILSIDTEVCWG